MWFFWGKRPSGFSRSSTADEVTREIDGRGLTAIVTGASSGIGAETARVLALRGVHVIMGIRNMEAGREVRGKVIQEIPEANVDVMELDLSSMTSIRNFASNYKTSNRPLNILINNAGVYGIPFTLSEDNVELQFATNYLGHFLLTHLLLDTMKQTARESGREGRIVNVSSVAHRFAFGEGIRFDKLNDPSGYISWQVYCQTKLANILHTHQLTKLLKEAGATITANSLHPGLVDTNILMRKTWKEGMYYCWDCVPKSQI